MGVPFRGDEAQKRALFKKEPSKYLGPNLNFGGGEGKGQKHEEDRKSCNVWYYFFHHP